MDTILNSMYGLERSSNWKFPDVALIENCNIGGYSLNQDDVNNNKDDMKNKNQSNSLLILNKKIINRK